VRSVCPRPCVRVIRLAWASPASSAGRSPRHSRRARPPTFAGAIHGDLGIIQKNDVVVALSYSGETQEILRLLETIRRLGATLVAITGDPHSTLAEAADVALDCSVTQEACPMNLVPTASTTAALALGDALAMTLLVEKGFKEEDFASPHPGARRCLMRVGRLMHLGRSARGSGRRPCAT
jgi:arabinose-5-phosphate isomerase